MKEFLISAKKSTYVDEDSNSKVEFSRIGSNDMTFHDNFFGGVIFMGEEVIYDKFNMPI